MDVGAAVDRIGRVEAVDTLEAPLRATAARLLRSPRMKDALHGTWLGHPLHPLLTDLPIGFWTVSWFLDLFGGRRSRRMSDVMIALGLVSAVPTAASGIADWNDLDPPARRTATVHGLVQAVATVYYLRALWARMRGHRRHGVRLAMTGANVATVGAYLGGHLIARNAAGVDRNALVAQGAPSEWTLVVDEASLREGEPVVADAGGTRVLLVRTGERICAIADVCGHMGGPLHEGTIEAGTVACPWHGSAFRLEDGRVVHGPATSRQPCFDVRVADGKVEVRARA